MPDSTQATVQVTGSAPPPQGPVVTNAAGATAPVEPRPVPLEMAVDDGLTQPQLPFEWPKKKPTPPPEEPKPQETPTPPAPKHSARALRLAQYFGFTQEEVDGSSPEQLLRDIQAAQIEAQELARIEGQRPTQPPPPAEPEVDLREFGISPEEEGLIAEPILAGLKALAKQNRGLHAELGMFREQAEKQSRQTFEQRLQTIRQQHKVIDSDLKHDAVVDTMKRLVQSKQHTTPEADYAKVATLLFGAPSPTPPPTPPPAQRQLPPEQQQSYRLNEAANGRPRDAVTGQFVSPAITPEQWNDAALARPTSRQAVPMKGEAAALNAIQERMRARGFDTTITSAEEDAF